MSKPNETDIHEPDGIILRGAKIGHADEASHVRDRDGVLFRGREKGYVDGNQKIRRPDGVLVRGDIVGQVKGNRAHAPDGSLVAGEEWGYVDEEGRIRQRDGLLLRGRIIGQVRGPDKAAALACFVLRFKELETRFDELEREVLSSPHKGPLLGKVRRMTDEIRSADALGDFDGLLRRERMLDDMILRESGERLAKKKDLCIQAESQKASTDWKRTSDLLKAFQDAWKTIGPAEKEGDEVLWRRFGAAIDTFYSRRNEERDANRRKKQGLCARAETLSSSTDWKATGEALKALQAEWREAGYAGRDDEHSLRERFRQALDNFFGRRSAFFAERERERQANLHRKERICSEAESLLHADDMKEAIARVKELQAEWHNVAPVPRDLSEALWERFRAACGRVFEQASRVRRERLDCALERKREQAERLSESIEHDEANIERWSETISNLRPGGRADEIREALETKIESVDEKLRSKRERLRQFEEAIEDIASKLRR